MQSKSKPAAFFLALLLGLCMPGLTAHAYTEMPSRNSGIISVPVGETCNLREQMILVEDLDEDEELQIVSALRWSSDAPKIASVDESGVVTAHRAGTAKITVTYRDNRAGEHIQWIRVKVAERSTAPEAPFSFTVEDGKYLDFMALLHPGYTSGGYGTVEWASGNTGVISVDSDGLAVSGRRGSCTVTATHTAPDGGVSTREIEVQVVSAFVSAPLRSVTITLEPGGSVDILKVLFPGNPGSDLECTSGDASVAVIEGKRVITAAGRGSCTVTITEKDGLDTVQRQLVTVKVA